MEIARDAHNILLKWKDLKIRKPLLLRGARQVGKTTLIRQFSKEFSRYIELNLEKEADRSLFEKTDEVDKLLSSIYLLKQIEPGDGETLLFIDEIQESPLAIKMLRYFYEETPDLFVIAAGSLLEFALREVPSFPVGRIDYLTLHPLNFPEFLSVMNPSACKVLSEIPVPKYAHQILLDLFHEYAIIGGMPEVISVYAEENNVAAVTRIYKQLWQSYRDDVEKYARNPTEKKVIRHLIETAPKETDRIKFEGFGNSAYRSREVGEAFRALDLSRIIQLIYPTTNTKPPLIANLKKRPRLQFLDTGLINSSLMFQSDMIGIKDLNDFYRGKIVQHLIAQEFISLQDASGYKPHFWVREEKNSNAEVDLVYQYGQYIIPVEVKSGKQGSLKSLHQFIERSEHPYAARFYKGEFSIDNAKTPNGKPYILMNLPYYLGTQIHSYIGYLIENHTT
ncbi:ATP-binding protein [Bacteroidota bacterium]